tara:strand:- start:733 stop:852 length:120 start_codon:yes stop_codon:yes gene_type:complete
MTETCLDKQTTSAKTDKPAANKIVAFTRIPMDARSLATV